MKFQGISFFVSILFFSFVVHANEASVKSVHCTDLNPSNQAPVFFDMDAGKFELGNIIEMGPDQSGKSTTASGSLTDISENNDQMIFRGPFGTSLFLNLMSGSGTLNGLIKYDPATGANKTMRIKDYPVTCEVQ